ncbi:HAMP domain-containing histidine kinase [Psychrobium sp. MM17-31]|uniref:sensor histidine kinase n=1 Tax=Psychrobium sp. MM17-31 TaxID=2917758 RepID=UPI001EF687D0|nr:HAMP domain-containing sensor histidine kinase [Psychrobium sp. MM17-31]MCG7531696.1 HAMP domain-containing histidine kinase [Psychrobium sp. MM17-31]
MSKSDNNNIDYKKILSAISYDMRNSLTLMFQSLQTIANQPQATKTLSGDELSDINYQVQRLNGNLTQLMALYNVEEDRLMINSTDELVSDVIETAVFQNDLYTQSKGIQININVEDELHWCLDRDLIAYLIDDVLSNAIRYSTAAIDIDVKILDQKLYIAISDDSSGYPEKMIEAAAAPINDLASQFGRMGIGLLFSKLIVLSHNNYGDNGELILQNDGKLGGSTFTIVLP